MDVRCIFERLIYPKSKNDDDDFRIVEYRVVNSSNELFTNNSLFIAKGNFLPLDNGVEVVLTGEKISDKYGDSFTVKTFKVEIPKTEIGMRSVLTQKPRVISEKKYNDLYSVFKDKLLDNIVKNNGVFKNEKSITKENIQAFQSKIVPKLLKSFAYNNLSMFEVPQNSVDDLVAKRGKMVIEDITVHPHVLSINHLINYTQAEILRNKYNGSKNEATRLLSGILEIVRQAEEGGRFFIKSSGHTCCEINEFIKKVKNLLEIEDSNIINKCINKAIDLKLLKLYVDDATQHVFVYGEQAYLAETGISNNIKKFLLQRRTNIQNLESMIGREEVRNNFALAPEQKKAVEEGLQNKIVVITGGPGTGKSATSSTIK